MQLNLNPNGRLAVYANTSGAYYGQRVVEELNKILEEEERARSVYAEEPLTLKRPRVQVYPNGMMNVTLQEGVRGQDACLIQWFPITPGKPELTPQRNKEEFFKAIGALLNAGVKRLNIVTPYLYDQRKDVPEGRDTIGAAQFCLELEGVTHRTRMQGFSFDAHNHTIVGFYHMINIAMDSVPMFRFIAEFLRKEHPYVLENANIVLPDLGAVKRGKAYAKILGLPMIPTHKHRISPTETKVEAFATSDTVIEGKNGITIDDIIATGSTGGDATRELKKRGMKRFYWIMTHPELTDLDKLDAMYKEGLFERIFVADFIEPPRDYFVQIPTAKLMARLIWNDHTDRSIGDFLKTE